MIQSIEKKIEISDSDITYFRKVTDAIKELEDRLLALEITKLEAWEELKRVKELHRTFSVQLRDKYDIPAEEAEFDIENKTIKYKIEIDIPDINEKDNVGSSANSPNAENTSANSPQIQKKKIKKVEETSI